MAEEYSGRGASRRAWPRSASGSGFHTVTEPDQARLLTDPEVQELFWPFLARERSASQVATDTGRDLNAVLYRVRQLLAAGLVSVVREVKRAGRPIKVYRSVHDAYFVPYEVTPFASLEERMLEQLLPHLEERVQVQAKRLREQGVSGQLIYRDAAGEVWTESAADPVEQLDWLDVRRGIGIDYVTELPLTDDEAWELQRLLYELLGRFGATAGDRDAVRGGKPGKTKPYSFSVALFPTDE